MIYLGADHAGFNLKEELKKYFQEKEIDFEDLGAKESNAQDDYPDFAKLVAEKVAQKDERGVLICGTGLGMCLAANKVKGVRAAPAWDEFTALQSREHLNANILCLGGRTTNSEMAKKIVEIWLKTEFDVEERHKRRLKKISDLGAYAD